MEGCIIFPGAKDRDGYGRIAQEPAHRVVYRREVGPIPDGMTVDHLCFIRACINKDHLRILDRSENSRNQRSATKKFCSKGHAYTPENTYFKKDKSAGVRDCRTCARERSRAYRLRKAS